MCFPVSAAQAEGPLKVVVLPFAVHAPEDLEYLESQIPEAIGRHLRQEGAVLLTPARESDAVLGTDGRSLEAVRELGAEEGADYVVWGSLRWTDERYSLSAKLVEPATEGPPETFEKDGEGIENLVGSVTELARDLSAGIFELVRIVDVRIAGNQRIGSDAIKGVIKAAAGKVYSSERIPEDIKAIHAMGYFEDIRVEIENAPDGKIIVFTVKEKQTLRQIIVEGNRIVEDHEVMESVEISVGSILNDPAIEADIDAIRELYKERNYHNVEITHSVRSLKDNQADLIFVIKEGAKVFVEAILFEGNDGYTDDELKEVIKTTEKGHFSWMTSSGDLKLEDLEQDIIRLRDHYHNSGYISAKIGRPKVVYGHDSISIAIGIEEGTRFRVGRVDIVGDLLKTRGQMMAMVNVAEEEYFNRETMRNDVIALTDLYTDEGYAYAEIIPKTDEVPENRVVDITYRINRGKQVYLEEINITGNTKTHDKVIRRELTVEERGLLSGKELKRSIRNLHRLSFFQPNIGFDTSEGSADDTVILDIAVKEQSTRAFNFGGVYSDNEGSFIEGYYEERNFLGRGSDLRVGISAGAVAENYYLRYIEPWVFGVPLYGVVEVYQQDIDYITYDLRYAGGLLGFSYPVADSTRLYLSYRYEVSEIASLGYFTPSSVYALESSSVASSIVTALRYDSRDRQFDPTEGGILGITYEYAGLGGDVGFAKTELEAGYYVPIYERLVGHLHGEGGYISEVDGKVVPDYERFYLGGVNSMRGFDYLSIGVERITPFGKTIVGGDKYMMFNLELLFSMVEKTGLHLVLFYDGGNVYDDNESVDLGNLRHSAGFGIRWYSPMGLIRIEKGYILDPKPGDDTDGGFIFTIGSGF